MRGTAGTLAIAALAMFTLSNCNLEPDMGFIEIKTAPMSLVAAPPLYLDSDRLDPLKKGNAVLRQRVGTAKLQIEAGNGNLAALCELVVKKNRITSVTVSTAERPPRCQCRSSAGTDRASNRMCVS